MVSFFGISRNVVLFQFVEQIMPLLPVASFYKIKIDYANFKNFDRNDNSCHSLSSVGLGGGGLGKVQPPSWVKIYFIRTNSFRKSNSFPPKVAAA